MITRAVRALLEVEPLASALRDLALQGRDELAANDLTLELIR